MVNKPDPFLTDEDNPELTYEDLAAFKPAAAFFSPEQLAVLPKRKPGQRGPGRKPAKVPLTIRVEPETLAAWKASGPRWQGRIGDVLRERAPGRLRGKRTLAGT